MKDFKRICHLDTQKYNSILNYHIVASYFDGFTVRVVSLEQGGYLVQGRESKKEIASRLLCKCYMQNRMELPPCEKNNTFYFTDSLGRYHHC